MDCASWTEIRSSRSPPLWCAALLPTMKQRRCRHRVVRLHSRSTWHTMKDLRFPRGSGACSGVRTGRTSTSRPNPTTARPGACRRRSLSPGGPDPPRTQSAEHHLGPGLHQLLVIGRETFGAEHVPGQPRPRRRERRKQPADDLLSVLPDRLDTDEAVAMALDCSIRRGRAARTSRSGTALISAWALRWLEPRQWK